MSIDFHEGPPGHPWRPIVPSYIMTPRTGLRAMIEAQSGRVGRRLAAIVAADMAGYSRLMGLDEVGTARTLREHRKVTRCPRGETRGSPREDHGRRRAT